MHHRIDQLDLRITDWMQRHGIKLLRVSIGLIFLLFGAFKLVNGMSPAEGLVHALVLKISDQIPPALFFHVLGVVEMLIGLGLIFQVQMRLVLLLLFVQMMGTFLPLVLLPELCFHSDPLGPTLEGQYILKNLILVSGALVVGGTIKPRGQHKSSSVLLPAEWYADYGYPHVLAEELAEEEMHAGGAKPVRVPVESIL